MSLMLAALYLLPLLLVVVLYQRRHGRHERHARARLDETRQAGLTEPATLHPVIDHARCIGSGACVKACPEKALGIVGGKAVLVQPDHCIGHGACEAACPVEGIQLVFGTETRGMDIPHVKPTFETNVPGIFIAGELGGMGLIRKAVEQGRQAIETIRVRRSGNGRLDVVIVGAGPAGIAASLAAKQHRLRFVTVEQEDSLGGATYHYPRNKIAMTAPMTLPLVGKVNWYEISKEQLLEFWSRVMRQTGLPIRYNERMEAITREANGFLVKTTQRTYQTQHVLLAIGRRGTPRKLGVPGEEQPKVVYRLVDAQQYRGQHVLVVGGGDSAAEAALAIADEPCTTVTLSCRGDEIFTRPKQKNRERLKGAATTGSITVRLKCQVKTIGADSVTLEYDGRSETIPNQAVIVCAGGTLPTPFLKQIGVMVETHFGTAAPR